MSDNKTIKARINNEELYSFTENELEHPDLIRLENNHYHLRRNGKTYKFELLTNPGLKSYSIRIQNRIYELDILDPIDQMVEKLGLSLKAHAKLSEVKAPMPGLVLDILVTEGQHIRKGDNLLILEAMKMENVIKAQGEGTISCIHVSKSESVEKNQIMISL